MQEFQFSVQNIVDHNGVGIAITGMSIVFVALTMIAMFIAALPKILAVVEKFLPPESESHHHSAQAPQAAPVADDNEMIAALGYALHLETQGR